MEKPGTVLVMQWGLFAAYNSGTTCTTQLEECHKHTPTLILFAEIICLYGACISL